MSYRVFKDSEGTEWQAWDVVPHLAERRVGDRRREAVAVGEPDRRQLGERRVTIGRRPVLGAGMNGGWLCFEAPQEKRRLSPIPADWIRCATERLEQYLRAAKPALRTSAPVDISHLAAPPN